MDSKSMSYAVDKVLQSGNKSVLITERGSMFGYQDLVVDFRNIPKMKVYAPVILDVTHSLQKPNQESGVTGGQPDLIETIAKAGIVTGADGIFIETHSDPKSAKSDGKNMLPIEDLDELISKLVRIKSSI
jgi:2-dehydro-3-deoxyphosphooctonate aldolase (KDO 8-P synthase)